MPVFDSVKDSGKRQQFGTGAVRDTEEGKGRFDLIPTIALRRLAKHYENGARKYTDNNWQKGIPLARYLDSLFRHYTSVKDGDEGEDHVSAVIWNAIGYMWTLEEIRAGRLPKSLDNLGHAKPTKRKAR